MPTSGPPEAGERRRRRSLTYRDAGVDIEAKMRAIRGLGTLARSTFSRSVLTDIGGFGGLFDLGSLRKIRRPVLVSSMDGVGTKLKVAFLTGRHDTVGEDLVNHCVNDILVQGALPLFFLDYLATGRVQAGVIREVVTGLAAGCRKNGCSLIGGETAEMPDFYRAGEYDLAGCIVGVVDRKSMPDGSRIRGGDLLLGLRSSGLHTNGYSLARKILLEKMRYPLHRVIPDLGRSLAEELLEPHRSYLPLLSPFLKTGGIKAMAHITGGGMVDNLPRALPRGYGARIVESAWEPDPIFQLIQKGGRVSQAEMRRTFNLGVGMILVASPRMGARIQEQLRAKGEEVPIIGEIVAGRRRVLFGKRFL